MFYGWSDKQELTWPGEESNLLTELKAAARIVVCIYLFVCFFFIWVFNYCSVLTQWFVERIVRQIRRGSVLSRKIPARKDGGWRVRQSLQGARRRKAGHHPSPTSTLGKKPRLAICGPSAVRRTCPGNLKQRTTPRFFFFFVFWKTRLSTTTTLYNGPPVWPGGPAR